ncbi:hypothetical protein [Eisenbergiella tayi]|uniref:hypothetical protein n=1 Tax=Eisenbergiella tayi TaxID=1432052 RepID=UPI003AF1BFF6
MSKKTEFALEMRKLRRRHIPILFLMVFVLITAWTYWCIDDLDVSRLNDVSAMVFTNLLLMNTILCPIVMAEFPIVKDTASDITTPRLYNIKSTPKLLISKIGACFHI